PGGSPFAPPAPGPSRSLKRRFHPPLNIHQPPRSGGNRPPRLNHEVPRPRIEELSHIKIDDPVLPPAPPPAHRNRLQLRLVRPIPIRVRVELRLHQRLQEHRRHCLRYPIGDRRHTKRSDPSAMRLRYLHRPHRRRKIGTRTHTIPDLVQLILQIRLELRKGLLVHSRGTLILRDLLVCLPHQGLGNIKRLDLRLRHVPSSPPRTLMSWLF